MIDHQLCLHVPYDRMPIGFFDKYFDENENQERKVTLTENQSKSSHSLATETQVGKVDEVIVSKHKLDDIEKSTDAQTKLRILEAARSMVRHSLISWSVWDKDLLFYRKMK